MDDPEAFEPAAQAVVERFRGSVGNLSAELVRNLDDPALWAVLSHWRDVGSYRRAFNGYEAKLVLLPLLGRALDEPSAYADPVEVGDNRPRDIGPERAAR